MHTWFWFTCNLAIVVFPSFILLSFFWKILENKVSWKNSIKIFLNFYVKNGEDRHLGDLRGTCHATSPPGGAAQAWPRPPMVRGAPWPLTYLFLPSSFSLPKTMTHLLKPEFLMLFISIFWYSCSAHHCCWDLEHLYSGMWLIRLSNWNFA
jgi:hypothetical protein